MSKVIKGKCFDKDLSQKEDLDFFLISSKDNIVINFNDYYDCYKRKDLTKNYIKFLIKDKEFYIISLRQKDIILTKEAFNHLTYRYYSIYKVIITEKNKQYGAIHDLMCYKINEYFDL
jgi:hypothetical protein